MSLENPTPLRIGMVGNLAGKRYRVVGRVVMGMDDAGDIYYWNEFNLVTMEGESATLVYEETESAGQWRLFTMFEPEFPMTAADAATKRIGDPLNLDGTAVRVTLVDESRVYHIEGEAPEGVEAGDVAHYFNCESGNTMLVVSWTGDEVEFYRGTNLSPRGVPVAFGIRAEATRSFLQPAAEDTGSGSSGLVMKIVAAVVGIVILIAGYSSCRMIRQRSPVKKTPALAAPLLLTSVGKLDGTSYRIGTHAIVEIAQVGRLYDRHEYHLIDDVGNKALLVCGLEPGGKEWFLFTPLEPLTPLTQQQAAAKRTGDAVNVDGVVATITALFQSVLRQADTMASSDLKSGSVFFGFSAQSGSTFLLAQWNESGITFHRGKALSAKAVTTAFH